MGTIVEHRQGGGAQRAPREYGDGWVRRLRQRLRPSGRAWQGATVGVAIAIALVWLWATLPTLASSSPVTSLLLAVLQLVVAPLVAALLLLLLGFRAVPARYRWVVLTAILVFVLLGAGPSLKGWGLTFVVLIVVASVLGGLVWSLSGGSWTRMGWPSRVLTATALVISLAVLAAGALWLVRPGPPAAQLVDAATLGSGDITPVTQPDPSQPGSYEVETLTYGSGEDPHRPEYGADVGITTASLDGSKLLSGWEGITGWSRTRYWGFDETALPLDGRVWYPAGDGRFPLVVIVHGDANGDEPSDAGFGYLGELLASRGFIVASIDENFLNTTASDSFGGLQGAAPTKAWLLLEHLRLWHEWDQDPQSPFHDKVETDDIALVGHSRGGEAVATAAAFNRLEYFPDDPSVRFDYGYGIRSVVAIAPVDGQYLPGGEKIQLTDVNYLTLQGSHDADIGSFAGLGQYHRVDLGDQVEALKSAVYFYRGDHSQFNTTWGRHDLGKGLNRRFIDTAALLPPPEQQKVAQVFVSAFLETTLHGEQGYRPLFVDAQAGAAWLPDTVYVNRYADASTQDVSTYDEDADLSSTTIPGGTEQADGVAQWQELPIPVRVGESDNRAMRLAWDGSESGGAPRYTVTLPPDGITPDDESLLRFAMAESDPPRPLPADGDPADDLVNPSIEVRDADGDTAELPLDHVALLQPQITGQYLKSAALQDAPLSEPILQTFTFPLSDFAEVNPDFDPAALTSVAFVFEHPDAGAILLDEIAVASP